MAPDRTTDLEDPGVSPATMEAWSTHLGRPVGSAAGLRERLSSGDLVSEFAATAAHNSPKPALRIENQTVTHGEIDDRAARAASGVRRLSLGRGDSVMLVAELTISSVIAYLGVLRAGAAAILVHPTSTAIEIGRMAEAGGARAVIGTGTGLPEAVSGVGGIVDEVVGLHEGDRQHTAHVLSDLETDPLPAGPIEPSAPAILAFTSGTTGRPKCTPLSHANLLASIRGAMWAWRWAPDDHLVHSLPISHQHGLSGIHATLLAGSTATLHRRFDSDALRSAVVGGATAMFAVPAIWERLLRELGPRIETFARLRLATSGSGPLPAELAKDIETGTGQIPLERYGSTEAGLNVSNPIAGTRMPGSVGLPLPGVEAAVLASEHRAALPGEAGELIVRGPQVFDGYRNSDADPFLLDWFRTGDTAVIDNGTGYVRIVGRTKELIISGGMNVYPREVEDAVRRAASAKGVAVVGVPSERWGEEVVAFVVAPQVPVGTIHESLRSALAPHKRPKRILTIGEIPRSAVGKVATSALVEIAIADRADTVGT